MMLVLRGLLEIAPDTPALDALADLDGREAPARAAPAATRERS
jgi:hypothetical protein